MCPRVFRHCNRLTSSGRHHFLAHTHRHSFTSSSRQDLSLLPRNGRSYRLRTSSSQATFYDPPGSYMIGVATRRMGKMSMDGSANCLEVNVCPDLLIAMISGVATMAFMALYMAITNVGRRRKRRSFSSSLISRILPQPRKHFLHRSYFLLGLNNSLKVCKIVMVAFKKLCVAGKSVL